MLKSRLLTSLTVLVASLFLTAPITSYASSCGCTKCAHTQTCKTKCAKKHCSSCKKKKCGKTCATAAKKTTTTATTDTTATTEATTTN